MVQGHGALGVGHAGDFHAADLAALQRDHAAEAPRQHQLRRMVAVLRGQHAVKGRGVAAALYMAEDRGAHLAPEVGLQALAQHMADAAQADRVGALLDALAHREAGAAFLGALADADDGVALALLAAPAEIDDGLQVVVDLGQQDDVGRTGNAGLQRQPSGMAPHGLDDHHAVVAVGCALDAAQRLGGRGHGGVEAKAALAIGNVVVDGLGHAHAGQSHLFGQAMRQAHGAVAADGHHHVQAQRPDIAAHMLQRGRIAQGVGAVAGAQDGAAHMQDARDLVPAQGLDAGRVEHQALEAVGNAQHLALAVVDQGLGDRTDHRIQAGAVATSGQHANAHGKTLL